MSAITFTSFDPTGEFVASDMFGANLVFEGSENGAPTNAYIEAVDALGVQNIRFGGGQADLDPDYVNAAGERPIDGVTSINIVEMPNGALRPEVVNFLEWLIARKEMGEPVETTLIIPTKHLSTEEYEAFGAEITIFVQTVMEAYGDVISAFQIGNEFWEMGETAYGQKASIAAEAIAAGLEQAGIATEAQPDILIQMATAGNMGSEFQPGEDAPGFAVRNANANRQVIDQLSEEARDAIDGVTEHYYYNFKGFDLPEDGSDLRNIDRDFEVWSEAFDKELDLHITEWNIRTTAPDQQGLMAASAMIHQFENMIRLGVDSAQVWTMDYQSRTALTLAADGGVLLDDKGRVLNSAQGAAYDLMSASLAGKQLMSVSFDLAMPGVEIAAYASETEATIYISSRDLALQEFTLNLGGAMGGYGPVTGAKIMLDQSSTNGFQWTRGEEAESVMIDGTPYYYNEHDGDVLFADLAFADAGNVEISLKPFEVIELTVSLGKETTSQGGRAHQSTEGNDYLELHHGVTEVGGGDGVDTLSLGLMRSDVAITFDGQGGARIVGDALWQGVTLDGVERLEFDDGILALDTDGIAGEAYRLYQASFDRMPDKEGLAFWIDQLDNGRVSLLEAAEQFIDSLEFETAYGDSDDLSDVEFLDLLYLNVLDRMPDAEGYAYWQGHQENGLSRAHILVCFSESAENQQNTAGQISDGIWFGI